MQHVSKLQISNLAAAVQPQAGGLYTTQNSDTHRIVIHKHVPVTILIQIKTGRSDVTAATVFGWDS